MARRSTAPSLWLPGFDPDDPEPPTVPEPAAPIVVPTVEAALAGAIKIAAVETPEPTLAARASWRTSSQIVEAGPRLLWPRLTSASRLYPVGAVAKFEANLEAIDTLQRIETENRAASAEERQSLQRYTGWGGLPGSFNLDTDEPAWAERARRLQALLPAEDYESARASVNNSHYTEIHVIEAMWQAIRGFGFTGGRVLEPAAGIGHFIGAMPENLAELSTVTAIEIDRISGRILQAF
ncbi:MAG: DEAD/DEAH box helicase, partial [Betaproteobacteria bacterium]|nr:DEAD/DEAH box helicase [Betaproteobacteria bacterium]